jgi:putative hydrolase of the HAD superfamily
VTNGGVVGQKRKIDRLGLGHFVQSLIISDAVDCKKPDAQIFELACRDLAVTPSKCWFIGDHPLNDVAGAMRVGMTGVWIHDHESGHDWPEDLPPPDHEIDSLPALTQLISEVR